MIDLHCHILPGVDDGPPHDEAVVAMLTLAAADGITTIVATPHARYVTPERVVAGVQRVNRLAHANGLDIRVLPGSEVRFQPDLAERWQAGELIAHVASQVNGKGGGRPDMAQGGGDDTPALIPALAGVVEFAKAKIG